MGSMVSLSNLEPAHISLSTPTTFALSSILFDFKITFFLKKKKKKSKIGYTNFIFFVVCLCSNYFITDFFKKINKMQCQKCSDYHTIALISHASKVMLKILQARLHEL